MYKPRIKVVFSDERLITPSGLSIIGGMLGKSDFVKRCNRIPIDKKLVKGCLRRSGFASALQWPFEYWKYFRACPIAKRYALWSLSGLQGKAPDTLLASHEQCAHASAWLSEFCAICRNFWPRIFTARSAEARSSWPRLASHFPARSAEARSAWPRLAARSAHPNYAVLP